MSQNVNSNTLHGCSIKLFVYYVSLSGFMALCAWEFTWKRRNTNRKRTKIGQLYSISGTSLDSTNVTTPRLFHFVRSFAAWVRFTGWLCLLDIRAWANRVVYDDTCTWSALVSSCTVHWLSRVPRFSCTSCEYLQSSPWSQLPNLNLLQGNCL